ncbi:MAG: tetratricopeptide repeat protein [Caldilineaceae bacterium]
MLEAHLLGQFEIRLDGVKVDLASRPAQSLLAWLLLSAGVAHRREKLAGTLWPDSEESSARRNLRQTLWQIRRALGPASETLLRIDDFTIAFNPQSNYWLDAAEIARPIDDKTSLEAQIAALSAYSGELLPGFYEDWVNLEREQLQAHFERKMQLLLERLLEAERWEETLQWAERWIALGGTPEPAYRALMRSHSALGDSVSLAESYRRCVEALQRELGVDPSAQTRTLYEQLRRNETGVRASLKVRPEPLKSQRTLHNLPSQLTSFVGREKELTEIRQKLTPQDTNGLENLRLLTLTGPGGTGKTRLAIQAVQPLLDHFRDGIWLVELATLSDPALIPQLVTSALRVCEEPNQPLLNSLVEWLRNRSTLLILDNCEHLIEAVAHFVASMLRACPQVKILITSRETLGMPGEVVLRVPSLALPDPQLTTSLEQFASAEAIRLFLDRATTVTPHFVLTQVNARSVAQICQQLDGIPLAIELAAARVRSMSVEQIAERLDDRFRLLTGGNRAALPRQQTLRATMEWSWDLLSEPERMLLRRLAVFIGGWTLQAAEEVCVGDGLGVHDLLDLLSHLVEKSLVQMEERANEQRSITVRYHLLETIRQYARDQLIHAREAEMVRSHHLAYFWQLAADAEPKLRSEEQLIWLSLLDLEHDNLRAALNWSLSCRAVESGLGLAGNLMRYWYLRGYWKEGRDWLTLLCSQQPPPEIAAATSYKAARAKALYSLGWLANEDCSETAYYQESLGLAREVGDLWGEAFALRGLSAVWNTLGSQDQIAAALQRLQESIALFQRVEDPWGIGLVHFSLGWIATIGFDNRAAKQHFAEGLELFQQAGDLWGLAVTISSQGFLARRLGELAHSEALFQRALTYFRQLGDKAGIAVTLLRMSNLAYHRGDFAEAITLVKQGMHMEQARGAPDGVLTALQLHGVVACYQGDSERGLALLEESVALARQRESLGDLADSLNYLARACYQHNDLARAASLFEQAQDLFQQVNDVMGVATTHYGLALIKMAQGEVAYAAMHLPTCLIHFQRWGDVRYIAAAHDALSKLALMQGERATALASSCQALRLRQQMGDKQGLAESIERVASCLDQPEQAVQLLGAAAALRQRIGSPVLPVEHNAYQQCISLLREQLGNEQFSAFWAQGQSEAAIERLQNFTP